MPACVSRVCLHTHCCVCVFILWSALLVSNVCVHNVCLYYRNAPALCLLCVFAMRVYLMDCFHLVFSVCQQMKGDQHNFRILGGLCRVSRLLTFIGKLPTTNPALPDKYVMFLLYRYFCQVVQCHNKPMRARFPHVFFPSHFP